MRRGKTGLPTMYVERSEVRWLWKTCTHKPNMFDWIRPSTVSARSFFWIGSEVKPGAGSFPFLQIPDSVRGKTISSVDSLLLTDLALRLLRLDFLAG